MTKKSLLIVMSLFLSLECFGILNASATQTVTLTDRELSAAYTLLKPEQNVLIFEGQEGFFTPSPPLQFLGFQPKSIPVDLKAIGDILDIQFHHFSAQTPEVKFLEGSLLIAIPLGNQVKAIQSRLGAISLNQVSLVAKLKWVKTSSQTQELRLASSQWTGKMSGTGVFKSKLILDATKKLALKTMNRELNKVLSQASTYQDSISTQRHIRRFGFFGFS
jgi:hypothetical protein